MKLRLAILLAALPRAASAGNGDLPRTPMIHLGQRCLTVVDRSVDPVVHLDYTIPINDVCLTADEPPDSRTHQLIAFCHGDLPRRIVPHWLTRAEADAGAGATGTVCDGDDEKCPAGQRCIADLCGVPGTDVLGEHPDYAGCWTPILTADERRPITCAAARPGVDWDTTALARGTYLLRGYTYEPPINFWAPRLGLFKIVDGPDPADAPPAVGFANLEVGLWKNQPLTIRLCVDAMDGSTVDLAHAVSVAEADPNPTWTTFLTGEPVTSGDVTLEFVPPPALAGEFIALRAEIVDPMNRRFTAYMQEAIKIETLEDPAAATTGTTSDTTSDTTSEGDASTGDPGSTSFPDQFDFCAKNPDADNVPECPALTTGASDETTTPEPGGDGCCSVGGPPSPAALLVLLGLRRRRRAP